MKVGIICAYNTTTGVGLHGVQLVKSLKMLNVDVVPFTFGHNESFGNIIRIPLLKLAEISIPPFLSNPLRFMIYPFASKKEILKYN